jgi:predicted nucleotidyltransferase
MNNNMSLNQLLKLKRDEILQVAARYGAHNVRVFGSVARREADQHSDIDLLVEMESGRSLFDLGGLQYELEQLLGCRVDVVTQRGLKSRMREQVLREAVAL